MDNATNQEPNHMTVRHRLYGVVISTFLGFSAFALSAQETADTDQSATLDQTASATETDSKLNAEPTADQFTKTFLQELSKEKFKEYMLNIDDYSKTDQMELRTEYQRRCSDDSKDSSSDLCPNDLESTFGNTERASDQIDAEADQSDDEQTMPELEEETIDSLYARPNKNTENISDPRNKNKPSKQQNGIIPSWRNK